MVRFQYFWSLGWMLIGFYGISTIVGQIHFYVNNQFYLKRIQFSISTQFKCKYGLIVKNISILSYSV